MSYLKILTTLLLAWCVYPAASQSVAPTLDVTEVQLEVYWLDSANDIRRAAREYVIDRGDCTVASECLARSAGLLGNHTGFSVLGRRDGERVCLLYVLKPEKIDDERTLALGHELLHCLSGAYH